MLTLYQFPGPWDVCSASCFCAKVEAFLCWKEIPHHVVSSLKLKGAPKGKVPYIEDENGKRGDSELILSYLFEKHNIWPDADLSPEQQGQARAIRYLCEEGIYRATSYYRFVDDAGWAITRAFFLSPFPAWVRPIAGWQIRKYVRAQLVQQGLGRHSHEEIGRMVTADIQALSDMLGDKPFFFGEQMHMADIVAFSIISNVLVPPYANAASQAAKALPNLVAHTARVRLACFGAV